MSTFITTNDFFKGQQTLLGTVQQEKIRSAKVLIIGVGGLGCPVLHYLALSGVGKIGIVDSDVVSSSNLHRQTLFSSEDIGQKKVLIAKKFIQKYAPFTEIEAIDQRVVSQNVVNILSDYSIIVDCSDNFSTKFLIHDTCFSLNRFLVQASVYQYEGQLSVFNFSSKNLALKTPCLRCLWQDEPQDGCTGTCAEVGVLPPLVGVLGNLQAVEVLKIILEKNTLKNGETLFVDLITQEYSLRNWKHNSSCLICKGDQIVLSSTQEITCPKNLENFIIIDVRSLSEHQNCHILKFLPLTVSVMNIPLEHVSQFVLKPDTSYIFVCAKGVRSKEAIKRISSTYDLSHVFSLAGGVNSLLEHIKK